MFFFAVACLVFGLSGLASTDDVPGIEDCDITWFGTLPGNNPVPLKDAKYCHWYCPCINNTCQNPVECYFDRYYNPDTLECQDSDACCTSSHTTPPLTTPSPKTPSPTTPSPTTPSPTTPSPTTPSPTTPSPTTPSPTPSSTKPSSTTPHGIPCDKKGAKQGVKNCKEYEICSGGIWQLKECSWGYYFDNSTLSCELNWFSLYC